MSQNLRRRVEYLEKARPDIDEGEDEKYDLSGVTDEERQLIKEAVDLWNRDGVKNADSLAALSREERDKIRAANEIVLRCRVEYVERE